MSPNEQDILCGLLGTLDAAHEPVDFAWNGTPEQYQAQWQIRQQWRDTGLLPWRNSGENTAERKHITRTLTGLVTQGLVRVAKRQAGLTVAGLQTTRQLCGHPPIEDVHCGLDVLLQFQGGPHEWRDGDFYQGYISEASLAGFDPWPHGEIGKQRCPGSEWTETPLIWLAVAGFVVSAFRHDFELPLWKLTDTGYTLAEKRRDSGRADPSAWKKQRRRIRHREPEAYWIANLGEIEAQPTRRPLWPNRVDHPIGDVWPMGMNMDEKTPVTRAQPL